MAVELKVGLFLGAGASVPLSLPATKELKDRLIRKYSYSDVSSASQELFYLASILNVPGFDDIEHVLQCIKELDDFFHNSYGGMYFLRGEHKWIQQHPRRPWEINILIDNIKRVRKMVEDDVFENYAWNHDADQFLTIVHGNLLAAIKQHSKEMHVFTTNYDRAIEEYCSNKARKCRCIDGFRTDEYSGRRGWDGTFNYPVEPEVTNVYLYKLHGSLTWKRHKVYGIVNTGEERRSTDSNYLENMLVYPTLSPKDGQEVEPYSKIREEYRKFMETANTCVVVGFSFRDVHLNSIFTEFYRRGMCIIVVSPSADRDVYKNLLRKEIPNPDAIIPLESNKEIVALYREHGRIVTINQALEPKNAFEITNLISDRVRASLPVR